MVQGFNFKVGLSRLTEHYSQITPHQYYGKPNMSKMIAVLYVH